MALFLFAKNLYKSYNLEEDRWSNQNQTFIGALSNIDQSEGLLSASNGEMNWAILKWNKTRSIPLQFLFNEVEEEIIKELSGVACDSRAWSMNCIVYCYAEDLLILSRGQYINSNILDYSFVYEVTWAFWNTVHISLYDC